MEGGWVEKCAINANILYNTIHKFQGKAQLTI